jgi:hypothetical protein
LLYRFLLLYDQLFAGLFIEHFIVDGCVFHTPKVGIKSAL